MTVTVDRPTCPNVFDADLPQIDYERCESLEEAHDIIRRARRQAPIAIGPHGPELLTYELVRSVLRDPRFRVPGANLARLELAEALTVITRRMPNARRTGPAPWKPLTGISGPVTLPIEFEAGH